VIQLCRFVKSDDVCRIGTQISITATDRNDGDFAVRLPSVAATRLGLDRRPWTWLRQVHGGTVVTVNAPGEHAGSRADAVVADIDGAVLAVQSADCAPVAFWSPQGPFGIAHAGWRGLEAGVIESTVTQLRSLGASEILAVLGPCIHPGAYPFGQADLDRIVALYGPSVRAETNDGSSALDVPKAVRAAVETAGALMDHDVGLCTAESLQFYSHRARQESGRQVMTIARRPR